jgi:quercetin dioxygenase-like cupin family protein
MLFESINTGCLDGDDTPWMPFAPYSNDVLIKYFKIDPVRGEIVALLKVPAGVEMPRHHHTGTVIVYTLQGSWRYKEHDWTARTGSVVYETASTRHTPQATAGGEDVITFNIVAGELLYLDEQDNIIAVENWKTSMDRYLAYCQANDLRPMDLSAFSG